MRTVPEWIGKTDDAKVPPRVRLRVFDREAGICHLTGVKIDPVRDEWDLDHKVSLILGGEHRESNLFPALRDKHQKKTAAEVKVKSKIADVRKKHVGITKPKKSIKSPGFPTTEKAAKREPKPSLPYRSLYRSDDQ